MRFSGRGLRVALAPAIAAVGLTACGSSDTSTKSTNNAAPAKAEPPKTTAAHPPASSGPPLAVALAIDNTMRAGPNAREATQSLAEFAEDTAILISSTIEHGGSFRASIFGGPELTYKAIELDPKSTPGQRYHEATKHYAPAVRGKPGERWVVLATAGFDTTQGELPLPNVQQTAKVLRRTVGKLDARGVGIAMVGVGLSPNHDNWHQDGPLTKAWAIVCHEIHARECQIHADPRLPPPLEGSAHAILEGA